MLARAASATAVGIEAQPVVVEAYRGRGLPGLSLVGLARGAVREALVRVRAALTAVDCPLGSLRLVANMLPAELPKDTSGLDLPLALALMVAAGRLAPSALAGRRFYGELSLGGTIEGVRGTILVADLARRQADRELVVSPANACEASVLPDLRVVAPRSLAELVAHLSAARPLSPWARRAAQAAPAQRSAACLSEVAGQPQARRALEVAAAGGHHLLLVGPPGAGKSFLARRLAGLLPPLATDARAEVTRIRAVAGESTEELASEPPFRAPHHTATQAALCGGGTPLRPGEVTLAHRGVLFLDELAEFPRRVLDSLREPLEEGAIAVARAAGAIRFPARVIMVAASNPCPCGYFEPGAAGRCVCSFGQLGRYQARVSGPFLDRMDLRVWVRPTALGDLMGSQPPSEPSAVVRRRVALARQRQVARQGHLNATLDWGRAWRLAVGDDRIRARLADAEHRQVLSTRGMLRILRVAATLADLAAGPTALDNYLDEALGLAGKRLW